MQSTTLLRVLLIASTGHTHDGTSGEGAPITKVGPVQDLIVSATSVLPKTTNTLDLGTAAVQYKMLSLMAQ
jgi:hypothetical protein